jgi:hypothetical protein
VVGCFTVISNCALVVSVPVVHEDLLHLSVIQVVQVANGVLRPGDQVQQDVSGFHASHKLVLKNKLVLQIEN